ncbi:MAG: hypothetical protein ABIZ50_07390 [Solirubrobacterales bacterium]
MARALLVGCGCRGRLLGRELLASGWAVRGTSRSDEGLRAIESAGIEAARADPDQLATITDLIGDVTVFAWLMGSASGGDDAAAVVNGQRLESLLGRLVDAPVRGLLYEGAGSAPAEVLDAGAAMAEAAEERWRIPTRILRVDPAEPDLWVTAASDSINSLVG